MPPITPVPVLEAGPVQLPNLKFWPFAALSVNISGQIFGPYTPITRPSRKVVITVVETAPDVTPAQHLAAIVSEDNGQSWSEVAGPAIFMSSRIAGAWINCYRLGDTVFIINAASATKFALYSLDLNTKAWSTRNVAIADIVIPDSGAPVILGIQPGGVGVAFLYLDPNVDVILPPAGQAQSAPRYMLFNAFTGANLGEVTLLEPDTPYNPTPATDSDWAQMWAFYTGRFGAPGFGMFGIDDDGNIWASGRQYSYDGNLFRTRTMKWDGSSATPVLSVSGTAVFDPTTPGVINSIGIVNSASALSVSLRPSDGAVANVNPSSPAGANVAFSAKSLTATPDPTFGLGRLAYLLTIVSSNFGNTRTLTIGDLESNQAGQRNTVLAAATTPAPGFASLSGNYISAEITPSEQYIDFITWSQTSVAGYVLTGAFYYWRVFLGLPEPEEELEVNIVFCGVVRFMIRDNGRQPLAQPVAQVLRETKGLYDFLVSQDCKQAFRRSRQFAQPVAQTLLQTRGLGRFQGVGA